MSAIDRRTFLKKTVAVTAGIYGFTRLPGWIANPVGECAAATTAFDLMVTKNGTPAQMARHAIEGLGGIQLFVKKGQKVLVKPNIGWDRRPEQAANTNPEVVAEIVKMCLQAGAAEVTVLDRTCSVATRTYRNSGIEVAAKAAGATVRHVIPSRFKKVAIPTGQRIREWEFYEDALAADVFINVPIAKHHSLSRVTLSMKNLMGVLGGERGELHNYFAEKICDINSVVKPTLTILDATRILTRNGPQGGNIDDVQIKNTIIAGTNSVAIDAFGASLFGIPASELDFLKVAHARGLGEIDLTKLKIQEYSF